MDQVFSLSTLSAISRHQNITFRHYLTKDFTHLRIRSANYRPDITVRLSHVAFRPPGNLFANHLIKGLVRIFDHPVLELPATGIGGFDQNKQPFLFLFAYLDKRIHAVRAKIGVYGCKILIKPIIGLLSYLYFTKMPHRICL